MTVWLVWRGEYSGRDVCAVFSTRPLAEAYILAFRNHDMRVEEWDVDPLGSDPEERLTAFFVRMTETGDVTEIGPSFASAADRFTALGKDVRGNLYSDVFARDAEHATKIMNERRVKWLVEHGKP